MFRVQLTFIISVRNVSEQFAFTSLGGLQSGEVGIEKIVLERPGW